MTLLPTLQSLTSAARLNAACFCITLEREALMAALDRDAGVAGFSATHLATRPHLFSDVATFVRADDLKKMQAVVAAVENVVRLPAYQAEVLQRASEIARADHGPLGAFMGYDFHLGEEGDPKLIEINTNAGGAFLNAMLLRAQRACCPEVERSLIDVLAADFEAEVLTMFRHEWELQRGDRPLRRVAIVDDDPERQYLYPEFLLARQLFRRAGLEASIADGAALRYEQGKLLAEGEPVDLVYNRLVDFDLSRPEHDALRRAYEDGAVVITPNPRAHALHADKRNLVTLADAERLAGWGVAPADLATLKSLPTAMPVTAANADEMWRSRRNWFFKPTAGHGGKAVYRGDKLTRGVWADVLGGNYIAQSISPPSLRTIRLDGVEADCKMDVRLFTYEGRLLLMAARLYQGQTTNFRTVGGGFAPVFVV
jgi:hypothetical protein